MGEPSNTATAVLAAAVAVAQAQGFAAISRSKVADYAMVSRGTVSNAFGGMPELCDAVMRHAVVHRLLDLVAQGLATKHPVALAAPDDVKTEALASLAA
jgi:AcrR family transcriptional regulator